MPVSKMLRRYRGWIAVGALVAIAAGAYFVFRDSTTPPAQTSYQTETATVGTLSVTVAGTGNMEVYDTTDVYPATSGSVDKVEVEEGDAVTTGTVLFTLDAADAEANTAKAYSSYLQAQQQVSQAQVSLTRAKNTLASLESTYDKQRSGSASATGTAAVATVTTGEITAAKQEVAASQAALSTAKAQRSSAELAYEQAKDAEDELEVVSPASGVVWSLGVASGDTVAPQSGGSSSAATGASSGTATGGSATTGSSSSSGSGSSGAPVTIAPSESLAAHLTVNEVDLASLKTGQRVELEFDALPDLAATGKVTEISSTGTVSQGVVTFDVWVKLDVYDDALRSGLSVAGTIVTDVAQDALTVPNSAVKDDSDGNPYVLVLAAGSAQPVQTPVEVGLASSTSTQILSGIQEGDSVVTQTSTSTSTSTSKSSQGGPGGGVGFPMMGGGPRD